MLRADDPPRGMRPNYSCGSLAAADMLGSLMQQPRQHETAAGHQMERQQQQLYAAGAALGGMYGDATSAPGMGNGGQAHCDAGLGGSCSSGLFGGSHPDMPDFGAGHSSLQQMLLRQSAADPHGGGHGQYGAGGAAYSDSPGMLGSHPLGSLLGGGGGGCGVGGGGAGAIMGLGGGGGSSGCRASGDDGPARSSLSMLHYAGATALGGSSNSGHQHAHAVGGGVNLQGMLGVNQQGIMSSSAVAHVGSPTDAESAMQKRRFVWTADLHSRFEAAVNALGLDNAKPKSILKLMNVEGLTKANIKSHLQKYRCLMQKKAQAARANGHAPPGPGSVMGGMFPSTVTSPGGSRILDSGGSALGSCLSSGGLPTLESIGALGSASNTASIASTVHADGFDALGGAVGDPMRCSALPDNLISQGESSLQRNLEVQEMTLKVQMELQEELSRQLQVAPPRPPCAPVTRSSYHLHPLTPHRLSLLGAHPECAVCVCVCVVCAAPEEAAGGDGVADECARGGAGRVAVDGALTLQPSRPPHMHPLPTCTNSMLLSRGPRAIGTRPMYRNQWTIPPLAELEDGGYLGAQAQVAA